STSFSTSPTTTWCRPTGRPCRWRSRSVRRSSTGLSRSTRSASPPCCAAASGGRSPCCAGRPARFSPRASGVARSTGSACRPAPGCGARCASWPSSSSSQGACAGKGSSTRRTSPPSSTATCAAWPTIARSSGRCSCSSSGRGHTWADEAAAPARRRPRGPALCLATRPARLLRADMLLVLAVSTTLWCYVRLCRGGGRAAALGLWTAVALGVLGKGLLALVLPGAAIALAELVGGELGPRTVGARLRALRVPLGIAVVAALALPWHVAAALRNPGFLWDYVVNQHLLAFFDAKLPRDSIPDSLTFFWAMFSLRTLPWGLLLPAAPIHGWQARDRRAERGLVLAWIASVLVLFSLASGRLEHYSLPALPAVALLVGDLVAETAAGRSRVSRRWLVVPPAAVAGLALVLAAREPAGIIRELDPTLAGY